MESNYFIIGADTVPTKSNSDLFETGNISKLIDSELETKLKNAAFRIFNLEVPLTDTEEPIKKVGPNLIARIECINGYSLLGTNLLTLANNHILDQGEQGLFKTIEVLRKEKIDFLGAGKNLREASKPFLFEFSNKTIGVYACAENEFSIATSSTAGANPFDPLYSLDHISDLKKNADYVIVLYHGGKEHYRYPSPYLQKVCRRIVEKGADLVVCQHSHCIGCEEVYKEKTIVYGQGNFIFDHSDAESWKTGLLICVDDNFKIHYIPIEKNGNGVCLATEEHREQILDDFNERSNDIKLEGYIEKKYKSFASQYRDYYLEAASGHKSLLFRIANKITKGQLMNAYLRNAYRGNEKLRLINYLECEAHRELFIQSIV